MNISHIIAILLIVSFFLSISARIHQQRSGKILITILSVTVIFQLWNIKKDETYLITDNAKYHNEPHWTPESIDDLHWHPCIGQSIEQLTNIYNAPDEMNPKDYTSISLATLCDIELYVNFQGYLATLSQKDKTEALKEQSAWIDERYAVRFDAYNKEDTHKDALIASNKAFIDFTKIRISELEEKLSGGPLQYPWSETLRTDNYTVQIKNAWPDSQCIDSQTMVYYGKSNKTGQGILLTGTTIHSSGKNGCSSRFCGYSFNNNNTNYSIEDNILCITSNGQELALEEGDWESD